MTEPLSPAAQAIWDAFNDVSERVGVFEDYGDALAAALRAAADQVLPLYACSLGSTRGTTRLGVRQKLIAIATELEAQP